jgi:antitoxin component YwqK of YwqJK toxin-antitoxin module
MKCVTPISNRTKMRFLVTGFCCLLFAQALLAQESTYSRKVNICRGDTMIVAELLNNSKSPTISPMRYYYWFSANGIHVNKGGYSGILLHGQYTEYDKNNNLLQKGNLKYGNKIGIWMCWYPSGKVKEIMHYKGGMLSGKCMKYEPDGKLCSSGFYLKDKLKKEFLTTEKLVHVKKKSNKKLTQEKQVPANE